jgi:hypothetical protein
MCLIGFAGSSFGQPAARPLKTTFGVVKRPITPPRLDGRPFVPAWHAQLLERACAERKTCVVDVFVQFLARQKRLRRWRGCYWIGHGCHPSAKVPAFPGGVTS